MRGFRAWSLVGLTASTVGAACSLVTDLSSLGADASVDAPVDAPPVEAAADGFLLTATPPHVTADPGDGFDITINITRGATFADIVDVTVNGLPGLSNLQTSPATLTFTASAPVVLHVDVDAAAKTPQDGTVALLGIGRTTQRPSTTSFDVRIGTLFVDTQTSTTVTVPPYASSVILKAWGAGGAAGSNYGTTAVGGSGGGGGMAGARFAVAPGSLLDITVGAPGQNAKFGSAGSGGGYSQVMLGSTLLLLAGGGGGGGKGGGDTTVYCNPLAGGGGLAGGGANAQTSSRSGTEDAGGQAGGTGATAGAAFQGGNGADPPPTCSTCSGYQADGGAPGGGGAGYAGVCQGSAGGGGGGGYYGGGGGALAPSGGSSSGGGGGSGFVSDAGADVVQMHGTGATAAATTDPDYLAGSASGGVAQTSTTPAVPATPGHVVVRLPKP